MRPGRAIALGLGLGLRLGSGIYFNFEQMSWSTCAANNNKTSPKVQRTCSGSCASTALREILFENCIETVVIYFGKYFLYILQYLIFWTTFIHTLATKSINNYIKKFLSVYILNMVVHVLLVPLHFYLQYQLKVSLNFSQCSHWMCLIAPGCIIYADFSAVARVGR